MPNLTANVSLFRPTFVAAGLVSAFLLGAMQSTVAADYQSVRSAFFKGDYDQCIKLTREEVDKGIWNDFWSRQLMQALLVQGRYEEALEVYLSVEQKFSKSISLRVLAAEAYRFSGDFERGNRLLDEIPALIEKTPWQYSDRDNLLALGKFFLSHGVDAREILEKYFDRILKNDPKYVDGYLAIAELALEKADYQEAVNALSTALQLRADDPYVHFLSARAWAPSDSEKAAASLRKALDLNPYHAESLLLHAQNLIDSEQYVAAERVVEEIFDVNPHNPNGWALKAAIAHLQGNYRQEGDFRARGLSTWKLNPQVDHLIGATLSKHYRFEEGVQYQRRALRMKPTYLPAKFQLAQDLLRVGEDEEAWSIVDEVVVTDQYNIVAYNLKTLQERLLSFTTIEAPGLIVRMDAREARIYGSHVVELLLEAKRTLSKKYAHELSRPVIVEIFPQQSDFAIRTFGLPGGAGFLGVCFGSLITANSPASQGDQPSNWESVLWHEFCHVVTLQKTNNRMPRWLSEGISVYEELERDSSWGQRMTPVYKTMLLGSDFVPLSDLSSAFLRPKSALHLQFAYFESSLAVRYLIEVHGHDRLLKLLDDLGIGVTPRDAFTRLYGDAATLDRDFEVYAQNLANQFYPETDFSSGPQPPLTSPEDLEEWLAEHPNHYAVQRQRVAALVDSRQWPQAEVAAQELLKLFPTDVSPGGALELAAQIAGAQKNPSSEREFLESVAEYSSDHLPARIRLIQLCRDASDWEGVRRFSEQLLAIQPLIQVGHQGIVDAANGLDRLSAATDSLQALQEMDPLDPAGLRYSLAKALFASGRIEEARKQVLYALEYAPRFREAQKLLVNIHRRQQEDALVVSPPEVGHPPRIQLNTP